MNSAQDTLSPSRNHISQTISKQHTTAIKIASPVTTLPPNKEEPAPPVKGSKPVVVFPAVAAVGEAYPTAVVPATLEANVEEVSAVVVASAVLVATEDGLVPAAAAELVTAELCGAEVLDGEAELAPLRSMDTPADLQMVETALLTAISGLSLLKA
ncbi:MAG: hypothetical protein M1836_006194 [Candelina mexicana]|nr:MAG: hypothetical protein M1836_006194 [Candelina mexicana]